MSKQQEPREEDLQPKPKIEDPMPSDEELEHQAEPGHEDVPEDDFMDTDTARADESVDDEEKDTV